MSVPLAYVDGKSDVKAAGWRPHPAKVGGMVGGGVAASTGSTGAREDEGTGRVISRVVKSIHVKNNRGIAIPFTA